MTVPLNEVERILEFLSGAGVMAAANYFNLHRDTVRRIYKRYGLFPKKDVKGKKTYIPVVVIDNECIHSWYTVRCSICNKILGSEVTHEKRALSDSSHP